MRTALFTLLLVFAFSLMRAQTGSVLLKNGLGANLGTYPSLQKAYDAVPATLNQAYSIVVSGIYTGDSETYPIVFTARAGASSTNTISILPNSYANIGARTDLSPVIVFDGASWVTISGYRPGNNPQQIYLSGDAEDSLGTPYRALYPVVAFINGAKHNQLLYCAIGNGLGFRLHDTAAVLLGGTNNSSGNDSNLISHCLMSYSDNMIASNGNTTHPNRGNLIYRNSIYAFYESAIDVGPGTTATSIDSNVFAFFRSDTVTSAVRFTYISDTSYVRDNYFNYALPSQDSDNICLRIAPVITSPANSFCLVANNAFDLISYYVDNTLEAYPYFSHGDNESRQTAIEVSGAGPVHAGIFHNTARFARPYDTAGTGFARSVILRYTAANAANDVKVVNNLFINTRSGGGAGSEHLAMHLATTVGITTDYNTYSSGARIRVGATLYPSYGAYRSANSGLDNHSNDSTIIFDAQNTDALSAVMYNRPAVHGMLLPLVPFDRDGRTHSFPYKGTNEIIANCGPGAFGGIVSVQPQGSLACPGKNFALSYYPTGNVNGVIHQWQQMPSGTAVFTNIAGANGRELLLSENVPTTYRMKDSCIDSSGTVAYSNIIQVALRQMGTLTETHSGNDYFFKLAGNSKVLLFWDFGDGSLGGLRTDTAYHNYQPGIYQVTIYDPDGCLHDTLRLTINVGDVGIPGSASPAGIKVYPVPAGNQLIIEGAAAGSSAELRSMSGQRISSIEIVSKKQVFHLPGIPPGLYILVIIGPDGISHAVRITKE